MNIIIVCDKCGSNCVALSFQSRSMKQGKYNRLGCYYCIECKIIYLDAKTRVLNNKTKEIERKKEEVINSLKQKLDELEKEKTQ